MESLSDDLIKKPVLNRNTVKDEFMHKEPAVPPWFVGLPHAWQDTNISPATDVCLHVAEYSETGFNID